MLIAFNLFQINKIQQRNQNKRKLKKENQQ